MKQALIIIDVQCDYFIGGKMPLIGAENALNQTLKLQQWFREHKKDIYYIQHIKHDPNADFFAVGSGGVNLHAQLLPIIDNNEKIIIKSYPNSFKETILHNELKQKKIEQLVICGMMTHMCVDSTTRQATELGYTSILIADACATKDLNYQTQIVTADQVQAAFLCALTNFSTVINTDDYLLKVK